MGLIWITNANYIRDYKIELEFNNKKKGVFDFENHLQNNIFLVLKEIEVFKKFKLNAWTIEWENGADFSPEHLLENINQ